METGKLAAFTALNIFVEDKSIDLLGICPIFLEHHYICLRVGSVYSLPKL